ncbi:glycogen synthase GlgA [Melioribacter sp. Ez-97]|uniref:glycogen synthase GlgA n=1 Tax=Melioribacter sp. Ez-97 TaxID=3423434 RepID=UPI003EDA5807
MRESRPLKVAFVASEVYPYAKTGGLADVSGSLPAELSSLGNEVKVFMPKYNTFGELEHGLKYRWDIGEIPVRVAGRVVPVHVHTAMLPNNNPGEESNVEVYFVDCPQYFHRFRLYTNDADEDERFILFMKGVIEILQRLQWAPDIIHCNDWQTALIPLLLKDNYGWDRLFHNTATVFTIHNIAYQGRFPKSSFAKAEIREEYYLHGGIGEYQGGVNFLKTAIYTANVINTVSENYARELLTPEYGEGMHEYLSHRINDFYGILNGVDYNVWNPETDKYIPHNYSIDSLDDKKKNKEYLLEHFNLPADDKPLIGMISRMVDQKGFDIMAYVINDLMNLDVRWIVLGSGEKKYEDMFYYLAGKYRDRIAVYIGYNNELAHLIEAGADIFLMPSKFEPCGLNQIYSMKYGTVPVVRKTGGLADTVLDWNEYLAQGKETGTGYSFRDYNGHALLHSVQRAIHDYYLKDVWRKIQINGMNKDYSWRRSAEKYIELYKKALKNNSNV